MAMEKAYVVRDTHTRAITALGYNPARREILMGCEDGVIKSWESDTGRLVSTFHDHRGWVTDFLPCMMTADVKLMFSSSNDGQIIAWGSGGGKVDTVQIGQPVYCMAINPRRNQILCGVNAGIHIFNLDNEKECGNYINPRLVYNAPEHKDIVRSLICHESRVYSAGYDQKLIIYDSSYTGDESMKVYAEIKQAHDAGISCLLLVRDNENNTWIVTGSFDKTVRIWSMDGKLVHRLEGFLSTVAGVCYVPRNKTIWASGGTSHAFLYDPKSGDNVSDFIGTFQQQEEEKYQLQILKYFPEQNEVVASTSRRQLIVWKYNPSGCITALKGRSPLESIAYTRKVPLLIFSGDSDGVVTKWERMQSNHFMYSKEFFPLSDAKKGKKKSRENADTENIENGSSEGVNVQENNNKNLPSASRYSFNQPGLPPSQRMRHTYISRMLEHRRRKAASHSHPNTSLLNIVFVEELDLIVAACEDNNIYVWGFDEDAVKALKSMEPPDSEKELIHKYAILLGQDSELLRRAKIKEEDSVTNRVAGFVCKHTLGDGHTSCVTSLAVVGRKQGYKTTYLISAGWDRRILLWDLEKGELVDKMKNPKRRLATANSELFDQFRNSSLNPILEHVEIACDGIITDLAYCPKRNEYAYSSSDKMVYLRKFATNGLQMVLLNTLQGHYGEVTCVKWNDIKEKWVTGSEDGTIRIWSSVGLNECEQVLAAQGSVTALCVDSINGAIVAGALDVIRVFEPEQHRLVQTNVGHTDALRRILHIPERSQYVSASWDCTIRVWNAWQAPRRRRRVSKVKPQIVIDSMLLQEAGEEAEEAMKKEGGEEEEEGTASVTEESSRGEGIPRIEEPQNSQVPETAA